MELKGANTEQSSRYANPKQIESRCWQLLQFTKPKVYRNQKYKIAVRSLGPYQKA